MVVLAASVCTKGGKALISRQFVEMTRMRIEALLSAIPKLLNETSPSGTKSSKRQHTFVETDSVRYVYQPIESLFLILVTTRGSNIVEDLETLRLLAKVLTEYCPSVCNEDVIDAAFEIVFAFDEVIQLGYKEKITLQGIRTNLEMDSHEEKLHKMIKESKEKEAKEEMKRKAKVIKEQNREMAKIQQARGMGGGIGGGMGSGMGSASGFGGSSYQAQSAAVQSHQSTYEPKPAAEPKASSRRGPRKGMQLGKKKEKGEQFSRRDGSGRRHRRVCSAGKSADSLCGDRRCDGPRRHRTATRERPDIRRRARQCGAQSRRRP